MGSTILYLLLAGVAGSLMAIQGSINASLGKTISLPFTTFTVNLLGTVVAGILLFLYPLETGGIKKMMTIPFYYWLGGPIGVAIIFGVAATVSKLGVGVATTGIIFFQLLTAYLIDHFGLLNQEHLPFTWIKSVGIVLMVSGAYLLLKK